MKYCQNGQVWKVGAQVLSMLRSRCLAEFHCVLPLLLPPLSVCL